MTVWQRFRNWRRSRPFWGGLLSVLAGGEIFLTMHLDLDGQEISIGTEGFQQNLIIIVLIVAGLLAWFLPAQRHFYGIIGTITAIYALIGVNLGGFVFGTLLGIVGGGLMFAWNPTPPVDAVEAEEQGEDDDSAASTDVDTLLDGPVNDTPPPAVNPLREGVPAQRSAAEDEPKPTQNGPRHAAAAVIAVALTVSLMVLAGGQGTAGAAGCTTPTASPSPSRSSTGGTSGGGGNIITDIIDFFGNLINGGSNTKTPTTTATPAPCPSPSKTGGTKPSTPAGTVTPNPSASGTGGPGKPTPTRKPDGSPSPSKVPSKVLPQIAGLPAVGERPSRMTGTRVTMVDLRYEGIIDLDTASGKIKVLKFTMARSDTNNFELYVYGNRERKQLDTSLKSSKLTVRGDRVEFYTSRFQGRLFGLLPVDYSPESEPPPIPLPLVFFDDPVVELVYVDSPILEAPNLRINLKRP